MKRCTILVIFFMLLFIPFCGLIQGQEKLNVNLHDDSLTKSYEPNWESLDSRGTPSWYRDAKFGIFIHWGLYSVPGFTIKGTYAEWYGDFISETSWDPNNEERNRSVRAFHNRTYGEDFEYSQFRDMFKCELFDPDEWADIFKRSGAKYVVMVSKHHDGYCLWPNKEASNSFGMPWNSVESGPNRDLVGDLTKGVRAQGLKMGFYYSIWDWFNPYWPREQQNVLREEISQSDYSDEEIEASKAGLSKYIREVMYPQFKQLVTDYQPALIFSDGDWWMNDDLWETKPLLAWLFNTAPIKDEVVINDRWGQVRGEHGGYFTTEYGSGFSGISNPWEENRGIGMSFGINRIENIDDYRTEKELIFLFVDLVSRGGNLLLNVGPNADGTIPVIMQERLIQIGNWLKHNGEAIYGTRAYKKSAQWTKGPRPEFTDGLPLYEMTINPKPGNAHIEMWFTYKNNALYALTPGWPKNRKLTIKDLDLEDDVKVSMLSVDKALNYKVKRNKVIVDLSNITINDLNSNHVYTFKIEGVKP